MCKTNEIRLKARDLALAALERAKQAIEANDAQATLHYAQTAETAMKIARGSGGLDEEWASDGPVDVPRLV